MLMMKMVKRRVASTERKMAKAEEQGRLKAQIENEAKTFKNKKHFLAWIKKLVEENVSEIPKGITIIGLTFIIKMLIDTSEELRGKLQALRQPLKRWPLFELNPLIAQWLGLTPGPEEYEGWFPEWMDWIVAFSLAYIVVEHGGQIALGLGEAVSGLSGIVGFLLG